MSSAKLELQFKFSVCIKYTRLCISCQLYKQKRVGNPLFFVCINLYISWEAQIKPYSHQNKKTVVSYTLSIKMALKRKIRIIFYEKGILAIPICIWYNANRQNEMICMAIQKPSEVATLRVFYAYLSSQFLSSHLQMRWQITPASIEIINEMISCMATPPFRCRIGCDNIFYFIISSTYSTI